MKSHIKCCFRDCRVKQQHLHRRRKMDLHVCGKSRYTHYKANTNISAGLTCISVHYCDCTGFFSFIIHNAGLLVFSPPPLPGCKSACKYPQSQRSVCACLSSASLPMTTEIHRFCGPLCRKDCIY